MGGMTTGPQKEYYSIFQNKQVANRRKQVRRP